MLPMQCLDHRGLSLWKTEDALPSLARMTVSASVSSEIITAQVLKLRDALQRLLSYMDFYGAGVTPLVAITFVVSHLMHALLLRSLSCTA